MSKFDQWYFEFHFNLFIFNKLLETLFSKIVFPDLFHKLNNICRKYKP